MRTGRAAMMLGVAAIMGLGAVWVANNWLQARLGAAAEAEAGRVSVLVAARDIAFGKEVEELDLRTLHLPEEAVPEGALRQLEEATGKVATQAIYAGELIMRGRLAAHAEGSALAAVIAPNKRAITVRVNDVIGVAGFLLPGNRVDVLATRKDGNRNVRARTLLEDIKVLAVDQRASADEKEPVIVRAVTLELTPSEGESLVRATQEGTVQLALRNPTDTKKVVGATAGPVGIAAQPGRSYGSNVTVIRGISVSEIQLGK